MFKFIESKSRLNTSRFYFYTCSPKQWNLCFTRIIPVRYGCRVAAFTPGFFQSRGVFQKKMQLS
jgi:hypothetical protein